MAEIVGALALSHAPQLMLSPEQWHLLNNREREALPLRPELEKETPGVKWAKWERCREALDRLRERLDAISPDVVAVVGDDQHENILEDNTPPFAVFIGEEAEASTSLRYLHEPRSANKSRYRIDADLAKSLLEELMEMGFDPAYSRKTRYEGGLGHAFSRVLKFLTPAARYAILPIMVNTYYPPAPSARRCAEFGRALAAAVKKFAGKRRVVVVASGGLSHTIIDEELDAHVMRALEKNDGASLEALPSSVLVGGTSEIRNWVLTAAALDRPAKFVDYVPLYRTLTGVGCAMGLAFWE